MDFFLFLLLNGVLFIRPEELIPSITGFQIYYWVICTNLIVTAPAILKQLDAKELVKNPVTVCVLGVLATVVTSHLARFDLWSARMGGFEFLKVVLYFLLLMAVVNTKQRLYQFLTAIVIFTLAINTLAVLDYNGVLEVEALQALMEGDFDEETGEVFATPRMRATGIFNDPNDLSIIIVGCVILCGAAICAPQWGGARFALVLPIGFLLYALTLTQSRGGLLALLAGCGAMVYVRFGWKKACLLGAICIPVILALGGRQTDLGGAMSGGTGTGRVEIWYQWLQLFKQTPLTGAGYGRGAEEVSGPVAHNSYLHAFGELGVLGGMCFVGMVYTVGLSLLRITQTKDYHGSEFAKLIVPAVLSVLAASAVSMFSLSRNYIVPTYLVVGVCIASSNVVRASIKMPLLRADAPLFRQVAYTSAALLAGIYVLVKVTI